MKVKVKVKSLSRVQLLATPWTAAYQAPRSMGFSRQEYWSGVPLPSPIRSMNQDKLEVVKQEMARVNIDILGISELRWTGIRLSDKKQQKVTIGAWVCLWIFSKEDIQMAKRHMKDVQHH